MYWVFWKTNFILLLVICYSHPFPFGKGSINMVILQFSSMSQTMVTYVMSVLVMGVEYNNG